MSRAPLSLFTGILAIGFSLCAWYAAQVRVPGSGHVLNWLDAHGFVSPSNSGRRPELSRPSIVAITDESAIQWVFLHCWWFAGAAMLLALWAEARREDTLYSGAGFVCGAMALALIDPYAGIAGMLAGSVALGVIRRSRDA